MSNVIGIEGIDNSGKTSTIDFLIKKIEKEGFCVSTAPKRVGLEERFPSSLEERKIWYRKGNPNEIIETNLSSALKRNKKVKSMEDDIVFESRGYTTILSSMIAMAMHRYQINYWDGKMIVDEINKKINYSPLESQTYCLSFGRDFDNAFDEIKKRDIKGELNQGFKDYLKNFNYAFERFSKEQNNLLKLSAYSSIEQNAEIIMGALLKNEN
ncbi:MAG: hypothetical protein WDZ69_01600 [Candidatus Pacearchaeota archaeon]